MTGPQDSADSTDLESLSFEEAYRRLSEMAESMDEGGVGLSDSITRYEEGMRLVHLCNRLLDEAELRISNVNESLADGPASSRDDGPDFDDDDVDDLPF